MNINSLQKWLQKPSDFTRLETYMGKPKVVKLDLKDGHPFWIRAGTIDWHIFRRAIIEDEYRTEKFLKERAHCIVDVGAHIGCVTRILAPHCERLLAFEPHPDNFQILKRNMSMLEGCDLNLYQVPLSSSAGPINLHLSPTNTGGHSSFKPHPSSETCYIELNAFPLPCFLEDRQIGSIDFLKIDAEGAEYPILASLMHWGLQNIKTMAVEYHPVRSEMSKASPEWIEALLSNSGFQVDLRQEPGKPGYGMIFATNEDHRL